MPHFPLKQISVQQLTLGGLIMDKYVIITWPEVQELMTLDGFRENSSLITEEPLFSECGSSAYFVKESWLIAKEIANL